MSDHSHSAAAPADSTLRSSDVADIKKHIKGYLKIGLIQVIFALATVWISFLPFQTTSTRILATLFLASLNGVFVAAYPMHLKDEKKMIWKFLYFTGVFMAVLFFLTLLARTDEIVGAFHNHH